MTIQVDYFTDVLCVWAYINERRIAELVKDYGDNIELHHHYVDVFGAVAEKMQLQWQQKGGYTGFRAHVIESAAQFDLTINDSVWNTCKPSSSAPAHLYAKAISLVHGAPAEIRWLTKVREAFFVEAKDISQSDVLMALINDLNLDDKAISQEIDSGNALAKLMSDRKKSESLKIKGSPSMVMNSGRQILFGNVGYGIIRANIEELLQDKSAQASWC
ncbi:DsbA family protein [Thalassotalea sp. PS06]|uniref:DsbA family oxidoreductase n=1 Tax=Thalassotalea sp. PS06 TaxID=2594005 RepID=UPI001161CA19|nr:DsbA family protein [Thalassotalea sp. PS06]QDP01400.1 disulfide bond formation protein DsbA [Thalassotalea sp. PS06]